MSHLVSLFYTDFKATRGWFRTNTFSKVLVLLSFIIVLSLIFITILLASGVFFANLTLFSSVGSLTALYTVNTALLVTLWLGIGSATISSLTIFNNSKPELSRLVNLPTNPFTITTWLACKSGIANFFLLCLTLGPIIISYQHFFSSHSWVVKIITGLVVLTSLSLLSTTIGRLFAQTIAPFFRKHLMYSTSLVIGVIFILTSALFASLLFPNNLRALYRSQPDEFTKVFFQLPLNQTISPTFQLSTFLTDTIQPHSIVLISILVIFSLMTDFLLSKRFFKTFHQLQINYTANSKSPPRLFTHPLITKDLLSITRVPGEFNYALFLTLLSIIFFAMLSRAQFVREFETIYSANFIIVTLIWLCFFSTAYVLRLVFPLTAREHSGAWLIFTQPLNRTRVIHRKLFTSVLVASPLYLIGILAWIILPIPNTLKIPLTLITLFEIFTLTCINSLMGEIHPNFSLGDKPERTSTTPTGMIALILSLASIVTVSFIVWNALTLFNSFFMPTTYIIVANLAAIGCLYLIATHTTHQYIEK